LFLLLFHALPPMPFWAIKKIQLPSDSGGVLDGNRKNSLTIWLTYIVHWWLNFLVTKKGGHVTCFWKALNKDFPKRYHKLTFHGDQKIFNHHGCLRLDDYHKVGWLKILVARRFSDPKHSIVIPYGDWNFFWLP
jgi:hypothetical protein